MSTKYLLLFTLADKRANVTHDGKSRSHDALTAVMERDKGTRLYLFGNTIDGIWFPGLTVRV